MQEEEIKLGHGVGRLKEGIQYGSPLMDKRMLGDIWDSRKREAVYICKYEKLGNRTDIRWTETGHGQN